jgi:hypothetical protein
MVAPTTVGFSVPTSTFRSDDLNVIFRLAGFVRLSTTTSVPPAMGTSAAVADAADTSTPTMIDNETIRSIRSPPGARTTP